MLASISTHLFVFNRLSRSHLAQVAAAGFDTIELWSAEHHFAYEDDAVVTSLRTWLDELGLRVASIHLPFYRGFVTPEFRLIGLADPDPAHRAEMAAQIIRLLDVAARLDCGTLIMHPAGVPRPGGGNLRRLRAGLDHVLPLCRKRGVEILLENIMMPDSRAQRLAEVCEDYGDAVGICLDIGHANVDGGVLCEIVRAGRHLRALHVHDNFGTADDHLVPGQGNIDWPATLSTLRLRAPNRRLFTFEINGPAGDTPTSVGTWDQRLRAAMDFWKREGDSL